MAKLTDDQIADNYVFFIGRIVEDRYPKAKDWQKMILIHAHRGLMNSLDYSEARSIYYQIKKKTT